MEMTKNQKEILTKAIWVLHKECARATIEVQRGNVPELRRRVETLIDVAQTLRKGLDEALGADAVLAKAGRR